MFVLPRYLLGTDITRLYYQETVLVGLPKQRYTPFGLDFRFLPDDSCLTCAPDTPNDVDGYKGRIPDSTLAAGGVL